MAEQNINLNDSSVQGNIRQTSSGEDSSQSVDLRDSVVVGDIHQNVYLTQTETCPTCHTSNVKVIRCTSSNCRETFCEVCHPRCRFDGFDAKGSMRLEFFSSGIGESPLCKVHLDALQQTSSTQKHHTEQPQVHMEQPQLHTTTAPSDELMGLSAARTNIARMEIEYPVCPNCNSDLRHNRNCSVKFCVAKACKKCYSEVFIGEPHLCSQHVFLSEKLVQFNRSITPELLNRVVDRFIQKIGEPKKNYLIPASFFILSPLSYVLIFVLWHPSGNAGFIQWPIFAITIFVLLVACFTDYEKGGKKENRVYWYPRARAIQYYRDNIQWTWRDLDYEFTHIVSLPPLSGYPAKAQVLDIDLSNEMMIFPEVNPENHEWGMLYFDGKVSFDSVIFWNLVW
jgi:hypothetical protein